MFIPSDLRLGGFSEHAGKKSETFDRRASTFHARQPREVHAHLAPAFLAASVAESRVLCRKLVTFEQIRRTVLSLGKRGRLANVAKISECIG